MKYENIRLEIHYCISIFRSSFTYIFVRNIQTNVIHVIKKKTFAAKYANVVFADYTLSIPKKKKVS